MEFPEKARKNLYRCLWQFN